MTQNMYNISNRSNNKSRINRINYSLYDIVIKQLVDNQYVIVKSPENIGYNINIEQHYLDKLTQLWKIKQLKVKIIYNFSTNVK